MSNNIAIRVENLSKKYRIGQYVGSGAQYKTLRESLTNAVSVPLHWLRQTGDRRRKTDLPSPAPRLRSSVAGQPSTDGYIWALKDVSFKVKQGEVLGIIGRNGAGKSTLLKVLTRITEPTEGRAELNGRVGSLLEVGTGFHSELTGRENIYLSGAILGMTRKEIDRRFDEIVDFSGVETFIDTPIKRYSSGMRVRLGFAVAAHLEPEILLVDEVLAVGDVEFQKKCLRKMENVAHEGRTVLFVSHNMQAIKSLCNRAILLDAGRIASEGRVDQVVDTYLTEGTRMCQTGIIPDNAFRIGTGDARVRRVELLNLAGKSISQLYFGQSFRVALTLEVVKNIQDAVVEIGISTLDGMRITSSFSVDGEQPPIMLPKGWYRVCLDLDPVLLPRLYTFDVGVHYLSGLTIDFVERALEFAALNVAGNNADHYHWSTVRGFVRPVGHWNPPELIRESPT
ncbi:ABC transporter ATP-binding protein [Candidatus Bipolaricaulota bacterium]|nr:ABC transporter ATP-binding protein [Candidatus Bipolaricaulota bacterium]